MRPPARDDLYRAAVAADEAWSAELRRLFGGQAGDVRYTKRGEGEPGSELRRLYDAWVEADQARDQARARTTSTSAPTNLSNVSLLGARHLLSSGEHAPGSLVWALANTIVSLHAACQMQEAANEGLEADLAAWRERGRLLADAVREREGEDWEPSRLEGWPS